MTRRGVRASGLAAAENPELERSGGGGGDRRQARLAPSGQLGGLTVAGPHRAALTGKSAARGLGLEPWNARGTQARAWDGAPGAAVQSGASGAVRCFTADLPCVGSFPYFSYLFPQTKQLFMCSSIAAAWPQLQHCAATLGKFNYKVNGREGRAVQTFDPIL